MNIICVPFAFDKRKIGRISLKTDYSIEVYLKNLTVALVSAKKNNPNDVVALVTNIDKGMIDEKIKELFTINDIKIFKVEYDKFVFPDNYLWSLAFYKLCVLDFFSKQNYDNICYVDADVYVQGGMDSIWKECTDNILLYDINHGLEVKDYQIICDEFNAFLKNKDKKYITHYGGEFYASSKENAQKFIDIANKIYEKMIKDKFTTSKGDEFILSLTADKLKPIIKNAGAYIFRFWTGSFRLVSTSYRNNRVIVLHLPAEKERGIIKIYNKYISKNKLPNDKDTWRILNISRINIKDWIKGIILDIKK